MPCNHKCDDWNLPKKPPPPQTRYGTGQVLCQTCDKWLWTEHHTRANIPNAQIHTHNSRGEPLGDPYGGILCDCCNMRTSVRAKSAKYGSTPELPPLTQQASTSRTFDDLINSS